MKELSIEQKARAYDKALNKARQLLDYPTTNFRRDLDDLFPELKESEDERIRKAISQCVEDMRGQFEKLYSVHHKDAIAWLEKQAPRITPEEKPLKESKNERIRKTLFDFFVSIDVSHILAWLDNQKSVVWSEEDEKHLETLATILLDDEKIGGKVYKELITWLKSIKKRMEK